MISSIHSIINKASWPCQILWEKSFPLRYKVNNCGEAVFDKIAPPLSAKRYILKSLSHHLIKFSYVAGTTAAALYGSFALGHLWNSGHPLSIQPNLENAGHSSEQMFIETMGGITLLSPVLLIGSITYLGLQQEKDTRRKVTIIAAVIATTIGGTLLTQSVGHLLLKNNEGHEKLHEDERSLQTFLAESLVGSTPFLVVLGGTVGIMLLCQEGVDFVKSYLEDYEVWKKNQHQLIEMEEGKHL